MSRNAFISIKEVEHIYKEDCEEFGVKFSKRDFEKFLNFLQIDFYDWVNGNLRYFYQYKKPIQ